MWISGIIKSAVERNEKKLVSKKGKPLISSISLGTGSPLNSQCNPIHLLASTGLYWTSVWPGFMETSKWDGSHHPAQTSWRAG